MSVPGRSASQAESSPSSTPAAPVPAARPAPPAGPSGETSPENGSERPSAPAHARLHQVDRAFLGLERRRPDVRWDTGGIAYLSGPPPALEDLRAYVAYCLRDVPLMTSRVTGGRRPRWQPDEDFAVDQHVHESVAEGPAGWDDALHAALNAPFAPGAYWGVWLVHGHADDAYAVCYRLRHACQDGSAAAMTFRAMLGEGEPSGRPVPAPGRRAAVPGRVAVALGLAVRCAAGTLVRRYRPVAGFAPTGERRLWRGRVPVDDLRRVGAAGGGSAHDAHLAALAGALTAWSQKSGIPLPRATAVLPVDARRPDEEQTWGNRCFALPLELPVHIAPSSPEASSAGDAARRRLDHVTAATRKLRGAAWRQAIQDLVRRMPARPTAWYMRRVLSPRVTNVMATSMPVADRGSLGATQVTGTALLPLLVPGHLFAVGLSFFGKWAEISVVVDSGLPSGGELPDLWEQAVAELARTVAPQ